MVGAIITLSIVSFVLLCATVMLIVLYRGAVRAACNAEEFHKNYEHMIEHLTLAIEDVGAYLNKDKP